MFYLILINVLLFSLGQLAAINRSGGGFNIYFFDIFVIFTNIILFFLLVKRGKFKINFPLLVFIFLFTFSGLLTITQIYFFPYLEQLKVLSYLLRFSLYFVFGYLIYLFKINNLLYLSELKKIFIFNFFFLTFLNILQLIFLRDLTDLAQFGWDPHIGRLTGTFLDPNFMAFYLCLYYIFNYFFLKNRYIEYLSILSVFLTQSRNGIITLLFIFLLLNFKNLKKLIPLLMISLFILIINPRILERFSQFSDANDSSYVRLVSWNEALKAFSLSNFSGLGFNNYKNNLEFYRITDLESLNRNSSTSTDSSLLQVLVTLGPLGILIFIVLLLSFLFTKGFSYMNFVIVFSLLFNSQFINSLFFPQICIFLFIILFLGIDIKDFEI